MTRPAVPLGTALARGPLVLDGGLAHQLEAQGCDLGGELWTARLLRDDPGQIEAAHAAYVRAGARVLITGSYQASFEGFARAGADRREAAALFRRSVALAREAAGRAPDPVWVAASVGPYGAVTADGGEYRGRYGLSVRELAAFHRPRIEALAEAEPDVLALETVPDADEVEALLEAADGCGVPVWLSCTVAGDRTRAGQPLADAFRPAAGRDQVVAAGVNCCAPGDADHAVETASAVTGKPAVVYPNSGERWGGADGRTWHGTDVFAAGRPGARGAGTSRSWALGWVERGARLIGGCCRAGPAHVAELARELAP
ncbi:homocysteine methyltransferase [Streptomyces abyssalis]|uniref:Homocysteine methyltransferase n=1 Tax=Streptomyces abyssalis TaxID=933944 RepID=A0A1E7JI03_9ACTN|nr:homocysteine S-methyltransferase [Streptomyces abyssalis]OEU86114.1 homocysteine methyltransferase [Streptomyces abyssalis]OEU92419.1 homocysteine methyltransferase [Streptomyces abyssalis]OEV27913.1 homocysteine methyltransferase [Streptomyces nanshensis]